MKKTVYHNFIGLNSNNNLKHVCMPFKIGEENAMVNILPEVVTNVLICFVDLVFN